MELSVCGLHVKVLLLSSGSACSATLRDSRFELYLVVLDRDGREKGRGKGYEWGDGTLDHATKDDNDWFVTNRNLVLEFLRNAVVREPDLQCYASYIYSMHRSQWRVDVPIAIAEPT